MRAITPGFDVANAIGLMAAKSRTAYAALAELRGRARAARHPWPVLGGAAAGVLTGHLIQVFASWNPIGEWLAQFDTMETWT